MDWNDVFVELSRLAKENDSMAMLYGYGVASAFCIQNDRKEDLFDILTVLSLFIFEPHKPVVYSSKGINISYDLHDPSQASSFMSTMFGGSH